MVKRILVFAAVMHLALFAAGAVFASGPKKPAAKPAAKAADKAVKAKSAGKNQEADKGAEPAKEKETGGAAEAKKAVGTEEYGRAWAGGPDGKKCYFTPWALAAGNYFEWPGEEVMALDDEGFAHVMAWENGGFKTGWVAEKAAVKKVPRKLAAADLDGDGKDETLALGTSGSLTVIGSQKDGFMPLCAGCLGGELKGKTVMAMAAADFDGDGADEAVVWMIIEGAPYIVSLGWTGMALEAEAAKVVYGADAKVKVTDLFARRGKGAGSEYYAMVRIGTGRAVSPVKLDEEAALLEGASLLPEEMTGPVAPGGLDADGIMMSPLWKSGRAELLLVGPPPDFRMERYAGMPSKAMFYVSADLNGDRAKELVFSDAVCEIEVHARKAKFRLLVNGKEMEAGKKARRLSGGRAFIAPDLMKGVKLSRGEDFTVVERGGKRLVFDLAEGVVRLVTPESEESVEVEIGYIDEAGRFLVDAEAAAGYLGFTCNWDFLSQTLRINI